jgi:hypothetical protein
LARPQSIQQTICPLKRRVIFGLPADWLSRKPYTDD